ncbi:MAG TPA: hypothetical protein VLY24_03700 [Bryobacteraceae bacterium]|nr:hypothetical protein [Bryobacteraceae bacterium]
MAVVFYGDNNIATLKNAALGVCFGQCTFFAKISKDRACVKTDGSTIQSNGTAAQSLFVLDTGNYYSSRDRIFKLHGLTAGSTTTATQSAVAVATALLASFAGKIVFIDVTMPEGRHVVAANLKTAGGLEYFDPNDALYRETSGTDFSTVLVNNFTKFNFQTNVSYYPVS